MYKSVSNMTMMTKKIVRYLLIEIPPYIASEAILEYYIYLNRSNLQSVSAKQKVTSAKKKGTTEGNSQ
jgi:hypothetical protein